MLFTNEIEVAQPPDEVFAALTDMVRVAPCLPGASIDEVNGDEYLGRMSLRLGPVGVSYKGRLRFIEVDEAARRAVLSARAEEVNGYGAAEARITTSVAAGESGSHIAVETDLQIRGRLAQFGRGAIAPTASRMLAEFAGNLEALLSGTAPALEQQPAGRATGAGASAPGSPAPAALDIGRLVDLRTLATPMRWALIGFGYGYLLGRLHQQASSGR